MTRGGLLLVTALAACGPPEHGPFGVPRTVVSSVAPQALALVDVDGDGDLDIATVAVNGALAVARNAGDGTFSEPVLSALIETPGFAELVVVDANRDGIADLAARHGGAVRIVLGNGDGTFRIGDADLGTAVGSVDAGDFDGDGVTDLAVSEGELIAVYFGAAAPAVTLESAGMLAISPVGIDVDGDGFDDLVDRDPASTMIVVRRSLGERSFAPPVATALEFSVAGVEVGDFDGDGRVDLLAYGTGEDIALLRGTETGLARPHRQSLFLPSIVSMASGDLDGDGRADLVASSPEFIAVALGEDEVLSPPTFQRYASARVAVGDLDGDGRAEVVAATPTTIVVFATTL